MRTYSLAKPLLLPPERTRMTHRVFQWAPERRRRRREGKVKRESIHPSPRAILRSVGPSVRTWSLALVSLAQPLLVKHVRTATLISSRGSCSVFHITFGLFFSFLRSSLVPSISLACPGLWHCQDPLSWRLLTECFNGLRTGAGGGAEEKLKRESIHPLALAIRFVEASMRT